MSRTFRTANGSYPVVSIEREIGKGGNSKVYETINNCCVKKYGDITHTDRSREFVEEYSFIRDNCKRFSLIPEYVDSGTDSDDKPFYVMKKYKKIDPLLSEDRTIDRLKFCIKLAIGIKKFHDNGIVHRDIKPPNIALKGDSDPVLLDYGTVIVNKTVTGNEADVGSDYFQAPELINPPKTKSFSIADLVKADVYSFVKTAWIIIRGDLQHVPAFSDNELYINERIRFRPHSNIDQLCFEPAFQMLKKGIEKDPTKRITMNDCIDFLNRSLSCIEKSDTSSIYESEIAEYENMLCLKGGQLLKQKTDPSEIFNYFRNLRYRVHFLLGDDIYRMRDVSLDNGQPCIKVEPRLNNPLLGWGKAIAFYPSELNIYLGTGRENNRSFIKFSRNDSNIEEKAFFGDGETIYSILSENDEAS